MKPPYFGSNKPPVPPQLKSLPSGLVVPEGVAYDLELRIMFNTTNGSTELQIHSRTAKQISGIQIAGILSEHATSIMRGLAQGELKVVPVTEGGNNGDKP